MSINIVFCILLIGLLAAIVLILKYFYAAELKILGIDYQVAQETIKNLSKKNELLEKENEQLKKELDFSKTADKVIKSEKIPAKRGRKPKAIKK